MRSAAVRARATPSAAWSRGTPTSTAAATAIAAFSDLVLAVERQLDGGVTPGGLEPEPGAQLVVEGDVGDPHVGVRRLTDRRTFAAARARRASTAYGQSALSMATPVGGERLEQLALDLGDARRAAEVLGVGEADVGDDPDVGAGDLGERGDVAGEAVAHLGHDHLGVEGRVEQGEREAGLVVERRRSWRGRAGWRRAPPRSGPWWRLAGRAGHADHLRVAPGGGGRSAQGGERGEAVGDLHHRGGRGRRRDRAGDERDRGAAGPRVGDEVVPVAVAARAPRSSRRARAAASRS